jgi:tRNA threonylcarbamoyl adenosine modification protein YeaZ
MTEMVQEPQAGAACPQRPWLLALHSSGEGLGVGLQRLALPGQPPPPAQLAHFPLGRDLSNQLFACVESVLPASAWPNLGRLAVATGPGGFTGTRLSLALARTLAQQLAIPLNGFSSFLLMARRLARQAPPPAPERFWLVQELPRHGLVAGLYGAPGAADVAGVADVVELLAPRLHAGVDELQALAAVPRWPASCQLPEDGAELLALGQAAAARGCPGPWAPVLPIYPTSPVRQA